jgi:hypothetical protein
MTVTNGLITRVQLLSYLGLTSAGSGPFDEADNLDRAINTASRAIEKHCGRQFYDSGSATARRFQVVDPYLLHVPDFSTTTGLAVKTDENDDATYEITWASTDYELEPIDGIVNGLSGWPYTSIRAVGSYSFPYGSMRKYTVQVTARWGWTSVPDDVQQAALQVASEMFRRKDAPFGIAQTVEFGPIRLGADSLRAVSALLETFRNPRTAPGFGIA